MGLSEVPQLAKRTVAALKLPLVFTGVMALVQAGCAQTITQQKMEKPVVVEAPPEQFGNNKTTKDVLEGICKTQGEGKFVIKSEKVVKKIELQCEEHGGIKVSHDGSEYTFNWPISKKLTTRTVRDYVRDKKVTLFGKDDLAASHVNGDIPVEIDKFVAIIPELKDAGYNVIGMEAPLRLQPFIDAYLANQNPQTEADLRNALIIRKPNSNEISIDNSSLMKIFQQAITSGLQVKCIGLQLHAFINNTSVNRWMFEEILNVPDGQKMAVFLSHAEALSKNDATLGDRVQTKIPIEDDYLFQTGKDLHFKPIARQLETAIGKQNVGAVDLTGCDNTQGYIPACIE